MCLKDSLAQPGDLKKGTQRATQVVQRLPRPIPLPQPITLNLPAALAQDDPNLAGVQPGQTATIPAAEVKMKPHGPVSERFMRHITARVASSKRGCGDVQVRFEAAAGAMSDSGERHEFAAVLVSTAAAPAPPRAYFHEGPAGRGRELNA
jgi:hypothetical protein